MASEKINICWFRRDLPLNDNRAFHEALHGGLPVLPVLSSIRKYNTPDCPSPIVDHQTARERAITTYLFP